MKFRFMLYPFFLFFIIILFTSCSENHSSKEIVPTNALEITTFEKVTAFTSYKNAEIRALEWNANAKLYSIPLKTIMASNLGIPPSDNGWYFMFKEEDNPLEFYIEVINGSVTGYTEAQPILIEELPYELLPIVISNLIDSDEVLRIFINEYPKQNLTDIELSLIYIQNNINPTWGVYLTKDKTNPEPLMFIDAVTGEKVNNPYPRNPE